MSDRPGFPEPSPAVSDAGELILRHLEHLRGAVLAKVASLPDHERRHSRLPSGWTPLELVWHLLHMERRWFEWGFLGVDVDEPWRDADPDTGRWRVPGDVDLAAIAELLLARADLTRRVVTEHTWSEQATAGGRFSADHRPTLGSICVHVLQEYARHAGHLDVAAELAGGELGE